MDKAQAIKKIRALLNLAEGTNQEHEKASAERLAKMLMEKHGITAADLGQGPTGRIIKIDLSDDFAQALVQIMLHLYKDKS